MRLISVYSNKTSFKPVTFKNLIGLNFIIARQSEINSTEKGKTFNGVGKSLLIAIIHFCLGSSKKESFKKHLPGWVFYLRFDIDSTDYLVERSVDNQSVVKLNGEELKVKEFTDYLESLLFDIPTDVGQLSFRSILPFFIRPRRASYTSFDNPNTVNSDYQIQATNAFLLGLDAYLVEEKFKLRQEKERIRKLVKELNSDDLLKDFFTGNRDVSLASLDLDDKIKKLENDIQNFKVAEDYYDIKKSADVVKNQLESIQNEIILLQNQVITIEENSNVSFDIKKESIQKIYKEASIIISDVVLKRLEDLEKFYQHLTVNRKKRLADQKNEINREIEKLEKENEKLELQFDSLLKYLDAHRALDVFVKLTNKLADLRTENANLKRYDDLLKEYHNSKIKIDKDFITATEKTDNYLQEVEGVITSLRDFFRELTKRFYPTASAGITIYNNDGDNQIRFDIDAKVEADASDGINSVKIFCYDLTLLLKGFGHRMGLVFHDSRLLDGIDPRQVAELFKVLRDYISLSNKQYILTINQNHLDEIVPYLNAKEYDAIITSNICHELTDDSAANKLLGIQIDMEYD